MSVIYSYTTLDDPLATASSFAFGINNRGQVVGNYSVDDSTLSSGDFSFLYQNGTYTTINVAPPYYVNAINDLGQILGVFNAVPSIYDHGALIPLSHPTNTVISAEGLNDKGQVVGFYQTTNGGTFGPPEAFLLSKGNFVALSGPPGATSVEATAINNKGDIVGWYSDNIGDHGFLLSHGHYTALDDPLAVPNSLGGGRILTHITGINDYGQIVGYYSDNQNTDHVSSFIYSDGKYITVNDPLGDSLVGTVAQGINNKGQIVGYFGNGTFQQGGFTEEKYNGYVTSPINLIDTAAHVHALTPKQIDQEASQGIGHIFSTTPRADVELSVVQVKALEADHVTVTAAKGGQVDLSDSAQHVLSLLHADSFQGLVQHLQDLENTGVNHIDLQFGHSEHHTVEIPETVAALLHEVQTWAAHAEPEHQHEIAHLTQFHWHL
jgi:uncharacterized membrane protein